MKISLNKKTTATFEKIGLVSSLDSNDFQIISLLSKNPRMSYAELSASVGLSRDGVKYRISKLIEKGYITGFHISIDPTKFGFPNMKIINISINNYDDSFKKIFLVYVEKNEFIIECKQTFGNYDFSLTVISKNDAHLSNIINQIKAKFPKQIGHIEIVSVIENE